MYEILPLVGYLNISRELQIRILNAELAAEYLKNFKNLKYHEIETAALSCDRKIIFFNKIINFVVHSKNEFIIYSKICKDMPSSFILNILRYQVLIS